MSVLLCPWSLDMNDMLTFEVALSWDIAEIFY